MRVAILTTSYPGYSGDPAGHFVEAEACRFARAGAEVHVLAPGECLHDGGDAGLKLWPLGSAGLFGHPGALERLRARPTRAVSFAPFALRALARLRALGHLDRVVAHFVVPSGWPLATVARSRGHGGEIEVVAHGSDIRLLARLPHRVRQGVVRSLARADVRFRFVSDALRREMASGLSCDLSAYLSRASSVELPALALPLPLPLPGSGLTAREAAYVRERLLERARSEHVGLQHAGSQNGGRQLWITACRLIPSKRVDVGLRLAAQVGATLWVVGDGPERGALEHISRELGSDAHFFGQLPRDATLALVASADRLIHMSEAEGAPTVVREARALGIPVLARPVGDLRAWAAQDPGILLAESIP